MGTHGPGFWVLFVLGVLIAFVVAAFITRRYLLVVSPGAFECAALTVSRRGWRRGVARYGDGTLVWYTTVSLRPMASAVWTRLDLEVTSVDRSGDKVVVHLTHRDDPLQLEMKPDAYNGFSAWMEAAPPGPLKTHT